jgi:DNA-binding NarL/FixJ family response regulator
MTQKMIAFDFGIPINTVGNLAANAYRKLDVHGAATSRAWTQQPNGTRTALARATSRTVRDARRC